MLPRGIAINLGRLVFAFVRDYDGDELLKVAGPDDRQEAEEDVPLRLDVATKRVATGTRVRATITSRHELHTHVDLFLATRTRGVRLVDTVHLGRTGSRTVRFDVHETGSVYAAFYPGSQDRRRPAVSTPRRVWAGPDVMLDLYGGRLVRKVVVYRAGAVPPLQGSVQPVRRGRLRFESQVRVGGQAWQPEDRATFHMDERGLVRARFKGGKAGRLYRARVVYRHHASQWRYFKFTRTPGGAPSSAARIHGSARGPRGRSLTGRRRLGSLLATHS